MAPLTYEQVSIYFRVGSAPPRVDSLSARYLIASPNRSSSRAIERTERRIRGRCFGAYYLGNDAPLSMSPNFLPRFAHPSLYDLLLRRYSYVFLRSRTTDSDAIATLRGRAFPFETRCQKCSESSTRSLRLYVPFVTM